MFMEIHFMENLAQTDPLCSVYWKMWLDYKDWLSNMQAPSSDHYGFIAHSKKSMETQSSRHPLKTIYSNII